MAFKGEIQGLGKVIARIAAIDKGLATGVDNILTQGAINIQNRAKQLAPVGRSAQLGHFIFADVTGHNTKEIDAFAPYAPYVEFGTGIRVFQSKSGFEFTDEMKAYAKEFYVNGKGRQPAQPFMFPALETERPRILAAVKQLFFGNIKPL